MNGYEALQNKNLQNLFEESVKYITDKSVAEAGLATGLAKKMFTGNGKGEAQQKRKSKRL